MTGSHKQESVSELEIKNLKLLLVVFTGIHLVYVVLMFTDDKAYSKLVSDFYLNSIITILNCMVMGIFLWYNWKKLPLTKKKKIDNTWMILFLGILGMWFWIPSKTEVKKMNEK